MEVIIKYMLDEMAINDPSSAQSNIPYPDAGAGEILWTAGTYNTGDKRVFNGSIYEVIASPSTTDSIEAGLLKSPPSWVFVKPANFYAALRNENDFSSSYADLVQYEFTADGIASAAAFFGVDGNEVNVKVVNDAVNPVAPHEIYNITQSTIDNSDIFDWWPYLTIPPERAETIYFNDMPEEIGSTITMTVNNSGGTASLENVVVGELVDLGVTLSGMTPQLRSTSRFIDDAFGNRTTISRGSVRELEATVKYPTSKHDYIYRRIERMNDITTAWAGTSKFSTSVVLGTGEASFELYPYELSDATYSITRYISNGN